MEKMTSKEKLKECLETRAPILYVGAGFTYQSTNNNGESIQLANGLCELLFEHFWGDESKKHNKYEDLNGYENIAKKYVEGKDLKSLCQLLHQKNMSKERNAFFTNYFSDCGIPTEDSRNAICDYPWSKIFTVNIDDLIENIYRSNSKEINVWNRKNDNKKHSSKRPTLIKLHGCVNNPDYGYVFDEQEYMTFLTNEDYILNEFGDAFSKNDIILVGTEFQEDDLKHIIEKYINMGFESEAVNRYFFVTPSINDELTSMRINESPNMYHVPMTATQFFTFLKTEINLVNGTNNKLEEYGLIRVYERYQQIPSQYESKLYHGSDITYGDLKYNWDIPQTFPELTDWINSDSHNKMIVLYGNDYVGKTCAAKRLLYDFFVLSYDCFEFNMNSEEKIELFLEHIGNTCNNDVAVLFEGAAYLYELLVNKIIKDNPYHKRIILITTDVAVNHRRKYHSLIKNTYCRTLSVNEKIDDDRAKLIYNKLDEKHSLSRLLDISNDKEKILSYMTSNNDLIDVLYISSLGRGFEDHINTYILSDVKKNNLSEKQIGLFCMLGEMGITYVPLQLLIKGSNIFNIKFNRNYFKKHFNKILQIDNGYYHLRYMRFFGAKYYNILTNQEIIDIIKALIKTISGRFNEGEYNELSSLMYKLLNVKSLSKFLSYTKIKEIYHLVEDSCKQYSYFWVQRGLCAQKQTMPDYEEADRFLREARRIRPESYQVSHAVAKNLIERGLDSLKTDYPNVRYFEDGIQQMRMLLDDKRYSKAFSYSLHAYIDSLLRYSQLTGNTIGIEDCTIINNYVDELEDIEIDARLARLFIKLKSYAKQNRLSEYLGKVTNKYWKIPKNEDEFSDEYVENDWSI